MSLSSQELVRELESIIESNLNNDQFGVEELSHQVGISRSQLHRKLHKLTNQSTSQFIREHRLKKARPLLLTGKYTSSEVAYLVGFGSATYFSKSFTNYFGYPPSELKKHTIDTPPSRRKKGLSKKIIHSAFILTPLIVILLFLTTNKGSTQKENLTTIAVSPFENLSDQATNSYFTNGIIDVITRQLSDVKGLRIISRNSFVKGQDYYEQARKFNATCLLEGSIQRHNDNLRIEVRLIDVATKSQLWARNFERKWGNVIQVQNEIAYNISNTLEIENSIPTFSGFNKYYTSNSQAYEEYLKGVYEYQTYTRDGVNKAIDHLQQAVSLDPDFALAYTYLSLTIIAKASIFCAEMSALEALEKAKPFNDKALQLAPDLSEAHAVKAFYALYHDWNFVEPDLHYNIAISNNNPDALAIYADYLHFIGQHEKGLEIARILDKQEPHYPNSRMVLSFYYTGQIDKANEYVASRLKIMSNYYTLDNYGFLLLNTDRYEEAINVFQKLLQLEGIRYPRIIGWMGAAYARSGNKEKAYALIEELQQNRLESNAGSKAYFISVIFAALGEEKNAIDWLSTAIDDHEMELPWLMTEPQFNSLHKNIEFQHLVSEVGIPMDHF